MQDAMANYRRIAYSRQLLTDKACERNGNSVVPAMRPARSSSASPRADTTSSSYRAAAPTRHWEAAGHLGTYARRQAVEIIRWPEQAANFAYGGPDLRTLPCCAHTSVHTLRVKVPRNPHPWHKFQAR